MAPCPRFDNCPFLNNFHRAADSIRASGNTSRPDYGLFLVNAPTIQEHIMTYLCNEHPEHCGFYGQKHGKNVVGFDGSMRELAKAVGRLRYDYLADFFGELGDDTMSQSEADSGRERPQLSGKMRRVAEHLYDAEEVAREAWKICEPRMKEK